MITTIVVGVDGSPDSARAVAWAAETAAATGARVIAVHAVGLLEYHRGDPAAAHLGADLNAWTVALDHLQADRAERRLVPGDPAIVLAGVAEQEGASLVVVGTRGAGNRAGIRLGSTSRQLAERSSGPLSIIPPSTWRS